jgi:ATP-dependent helicase/nuclease subunit B
VSFASIRLPADARFWPQAARAVIDFASSAGIAARQWHALTWIVPGGVHAAQARAALREQAGPAAFMPPRVLPLAAWLGRPLRSGMAARAELFAALRANAWVRESFTAQPAALWSLAASVADLADQLSFAALGEADAFAGRLQASLARHFHRRAARAVLPQAQLVLALWHARRAAGDGAAAALRELQARAAAARGPLVYLAGDPLGAGLAGWERAFVDAHAAGAPLLLLEPDLAAALASRPMLAAAWPELGGDEAPAPIARRGDAVPAGEPPGLSVIAAESLEEEAAALAQQVLDWLREGLGSIALVALDRLTARRVRALLERAQVTVLDETGWKLSTTSAAAAVMRWYDLVADDLYWRDLLDWLKSNFTLAGRPDKASEVAALERAIRAGGALQGAGAIRRALADDGARRPFGDGALAGAGEILDLLAGQMRLARQAGPTLSAHLRALEASLDALGMRAALEADPVGRAVLREVTGLQADVASVAGRATLAEFRAMLAARFEEAAFVDAEVDSPVVLVSLAATALRRFDAAALVGADARHLPAVPGELLFMSNAVRAELGLATAQAALRAQAAQLASLLATVPRVVATWRLRCGDEPNALSPLLQRLRLVAMRRSADDPVRRAVREALAVAAEPTSRPAPGAGALLPARVSASQAQSLVDCGYQFYARRLLQLDEPEDVIEMPDKRDFGNALHAVLRRFHAQWGGAAFEQLDAALLAGSLREHAGAVFAPLIARSPAMLAFERRFDGLVAGYVDWLRRHAAEGWRWAGGEEARTAPIVLRDGRELDLVGRIDRIDRGAQGQARVIDYKARPADALRRGLTRPGEDVQLPFYALLLGGEAGSAAYLSFDRAGVGEPGVTAVEPPQPFGELTDAVERRLRADLQRIADGAPLPALGVDSVCRHCEMRGLCRRDYWQHGGDGAADGGRA